MGSCSIEAVEVPVICATLSRPSVPSKVLQDFESLPFADDYQRDRYTVSLPWKLNFDRSKLLNNEPLARKRLECQSRKLSKDPELEQRYNEVIAEMQASGVVEEVPANELNTPNPTFYMPHRPVIRETSVSTKVRPVFDASIKGVNELAESLSVPDFLLCFRRFIDRRGLPCVVYSDNAKTFVKARSKLGDFYGHLSPS
ncbi:hypothetical protein HOLleu_04422 [Holothuria leucospilota]|uniref:Integrase catalytic domain-containing protein n=1 Tax=Holothuria leucospilota TaxID=206669 RepID=A0A9Q1HKT5_HOLLE|nr:hypothetical protein HOLleu_04422 [Holothuria leucospilota]